MPRIKLVLSDMDGTLLPFGGQAISDRTQAAIGKLLDAGIAFGPASGRERSDLIRFFHNDERCVESGIMGNGKLIYLDGELVYRRPLPRDQVELLAESVASLPGVMLNFYLPLDERGCGKTGFGSIGVTEEEFAVHFSDAPSEAIFAELPEGDITTCAVIVDTQTTSMEATQAAITAACPGLTFPQPSPMVFDVLEHDWTKVSALPILQDHLGVTADEIVYLGDSENDLTMMAALPNSFCMGNGSDEAKAAARWVVDTCENDGAAQVMEALAASGGVL